MNGAELNQPIHLKTPNLILNLPSAIRTTDIRERIEFPTGPVVTPLQILGAIYTYYSLPVTAEELDRLENEDDERVKDIVIETRINMTQGETVPRFELMGDETFFEALDDNPDGSFTLELS